MGGKLNAVLNRIKRIKENLKRIKCYNFRAMHHILLKFDQKLQDMAF